VKLDTNFLFELDQKCLAIINTIVDKQNEMFVPGVSIAFEGCQRKLKLFKTVSVIELKKMKGEYLSITKLHPPKSVTEGGETFLAFLETALERLG
jgi:hypothetical protein